MGELELPGWLEEDLAHARPSPPAARGAWSLANLSQLAGIVAVAVTLTVSAVTGIAYAVNLAGNVRQLTAAVEKLDGTIEREQTRTAQLETDVAELRASAAAAAHTTDNIDRRVSSLELGHASRE